MHQKRLAAGLRPDTLGELERSPRPPSTVGAMEGNTIRSKGASQTLFSHDKITINVCGLAPPGPPGELKRSPRPPSTVGAMEGNTLAAVKGRFAARKDGGKYVGRSGDE